MNAASIALNPGSPKEPGLTQSYKILCRDGVLAVVQPLLTF